MNTKPTEIIVSGIMVRDDFPAPKGTIRIYRRDDRTGAIARYRSHTNHGYSGYYLASIHDGQGWRKLQFNCLVPYVDRSYEIARECPRVEAYLREKIREWAGRVARYDFETKSFRIRELEFDR